jgi:hypothetical protein
MIIEDRQLCKACATGNEKHPHTGDMNSCIRGREEFIRQLDPKDQIRAMMIHERLSPEMAAYILNLSNARNQTPLEVVLSEGLSFFNK